MSTTSRLPTHTMSISMPSAIPIAPLFTFCSKRGLPDIASIETCSFLHPHSTHYDGNLRAEGAEPRGQGRASHCIGRDRFETGINIEDLSSASSRMGALPPTLLQAVVYLLSNSLSWPLSI